MCAASLGKDVKNTIFQNLNIRTSKMVFEKQGKNGQKRENWSQMIYLVLFFKNQDIKK